MTRSYYCFGKKKWLLRFSFRCTDSNPIAVCFSTSTLSVIVGIRFIAQKVSFIVCSSEEGHFAYQFLNVLTWTTNRLDILSLPRIKFLTILHKRKLFLLHRIHSNIFHSYILLWLHTFIASYLQSASDDVQISKTEFIVQSHTYYPFPFWPIELCPYCTTRRFCLVALDPARHVAFILLSLLALESRLQTTPIIDRVLNDQLLSLFSTREYFQTISKDSLLIGIC